MYDPTANLTPDQKARILAHLARVQAYFDAAGDQLVDISPELYAEAMALVAEVGDDAYSWYADSYDGDG